MIARAKYFLMRWWLYLFYSTWTLWAECFIVVKIKNEWTAKKYNKKGWRNWNLAQSVLYKNTPKMSAKNITITLLGWMFRRSNRKYLIQPGILSRSSAVIVICLIYERQSLSGIPRTIMTVRRSYVHVKQKQ